MGWFDDAGVEGYRAPGGGFTGDLNVTGAGSDPFGYTNGSLLTPWTEQFKAPEAASGGYSAPTIAPFNFGQFNYQGPSAGRFDERAPIAEKYADFVAPDAETFKQDPGYQFRLKEGARAMTNSAAAKGNLLGGAFAKALQGYGQEQASQEYGNAYNRALTNYSTNRDTAQQYFGNQTTTYNGNLAAFGANTQAANADAQNGLAAATAGYDRNLNLARTQWQDAANQAQAAASAGSANANQAYNRALSEYQMRYGIFKDNQDTQYSRIRDQQLLGMSAAGQMGGYGAQYGANAANIYGQQGNAQAAGTMGGANAWNSAIQNGVNVGLGGYYANQYGAR